MHRGFSVQSEQVYFQAGADKLPHDLNLQHRIETELGEAMRFSTPFRVEKATYTLVRKPEGSECGMSGCTLSGPDKPGVYTVVCELGGHWTRTLEVCAFHPRQVFGLATLTADEKHGKRREFRCWINDPARTTDEITARLEGDERLAALKSEPRVEVNVPHRQPAPKAERGGKALTAHG